ncbi:MAG: hypothetical protein ACLFV5_10085 [Anaerolineales bacterium]
MTEISIRGTEFLLDGESTYTGRMFDGHRIQGLLFNVRAVQATFDDANPETRSNWAYPDTGVWDPQRNVREFCEALPSWRRHGVLAFTINVQGGGPLYIPEIYQNYDNNGFTPQGHLKAAYAGRMARVLERADELGMVVIVGFFYWVFLRQMEGEEAVWRAAHETLEFLEGTGHRNVLIELANEVDVVVDRTSYNIFRWNRVREMVEELREEHPDFLYSTSGGGADVETGRGMPSPSLVESADYVLLHGNGTRPPELAAAIQAVKDMPAYGREPKPIVINEDSPAVANMDAAWRNGASWGYFDQGFEDQGDDPYESYQKRPRTNEGPYTELNGFQTPPVNWTINTPFKRAFFDRVAEVTGAGEEGGE